MEDPDSHDVAHWSARLWRYACRAWPKVRAVKGPFFGLLVIGCLIVGVAVFFGTREIYRPEIESLNRAVRDRNGTIQQHIATIESLKAKQKNDITRGTYRLNSEQWAKFIEAAKVPAGVIHEIFLTYNLSCGECFRLADAAAGRLMMLPGWTLVGGGTGGDMGDPAQGINVRVHSKQPAPESAVAIVQAFQAAGLSVSIVEYAGLRKGAMPHVYIGVEPE